MALSLKQKKMLTALQDNLCNVSKACESVGISRASHYQMLDKNRHYKKAVEDLNDQMLDEAEQLLFTQLPESPTLLIFYLKTKGKSRGYSERIELDHSGEVTGINLTILNDT